MQDEEKNKNLFPSEEEEELDTLNGEAEYPYYDFIGIEDRWLPENDGLERARGSDFNACAVKFANIPQLLVPWSRQEFKKNLRDFIEDLAEKKRKERAESVSLVQHLNPEMSEKITSILLGKDVKDGKGDTE